ncbi:MAG: aldehyde dehydrogenase, partial [Halieaceae bacterium]|nr:aldehyde dehydrogenase [Halieaceae bacterium]
MNKSEGIISPELEAARDEVALLMERARVAQAKIAEYTQEQVDELITAMVWAVAQ